MSLANIKALKSEKGFTIVELLIVIVIIGILAAIVIVAYNGITQRANAAGAKSNAQGVQKVAEAYAADTGNGSYPSLAQLTGWTTGVTKLPTGVTVDGTAPTSADADGKHIQYVAKGTTGGCIAYWDASLSTPGLGKVYVGNATSLSGTTCS